MKDPSALWKVSMTECFAQYNWHFRNILQIYLDIYIRVKVQRYQLLYLSVQVNVMASTLLV